MRKIVFSFLLVALIKTGEAQDPHFSQYYASPSTVNPANAGFFQGDLRVTSLYRQQWPQYGEPFVTGTMAFEFKPGKFKLEGAKDRLAIGGMLMFDRTPDAVLKSQHAYLMMAYHKALDEEGYHRLGVGFMGGYNQKSLDPTQLTFGDEFQSGGFQPGSGGEVIPAKRVDAFDVHAGILYTYEDDFKTIYAGASSYHLANPKNYFLDNNTVLESIPKRWNINAGININTGNLQYAGSLLLMRQANVNEILVGGAVGIPLNVDRGVLYLGIWYRYNESIIPTINLQWEKINLGFSYDAFSSQKTIVKPRTIEVSFTFRATKYRDMKTGCFSF